MKKQPLGMLRSLIVIPDWISFADPDKPSDLKWIYKDKTVNSIETSSVIFIPVDFSRLILYRYSYLLFHGIGIFYTKFSLKEKIISTDFRYLTGFVIPEKKWLDNHFNTEPFVFPSFNTFMIASENLLEFSFSALHIQNNYTGQSRQAFARGRMLTQLILPLKEPLVMLRKAAEKYEEFYYVPSPMRVLMCEFFNEIFLNEIAIESKNTTYEENIPGIRRIKPNLMKIFPKPWRNEDFLNGLHHEVSQIAEDFALIGAPMILK
ncbi:hypothetical protein [Candidatus Hodarchaeum mangrovi]